MSATNGTTARDAILGRIRLALQDRPRDASPESHAVPRTYRTVDGNDESTRIHQFAERVREYRAAVHHVAPDELTAAIAAACERRGAKVLAVPRDLPDHWIPAGVEGKRDHDLSNDELNGVDGVLTGCAWGIAQTGTIVLDAGACQGRRAITLLPDYHLCVIRVDQIVGLVPEAVAKLRDSAADPARPMTWISGPSATSDIELNRVEGVHGPRTLEVLIVG